jgi:hypothetical protein
MVASQQSQEGVKKSEPFCAISFSLNEIRFELWLAMSSSEQNPSPRLKQVNRKQMLLRAIDVEQLIEPEHSARTIWELVGQLDLASFYQSVRSFEGSAGRSAFDPRLLISIWIYAYSRGIGSAREISRLC